MSSLIALVLFGSSIDVGFSGEVIVVDGTGEPINVLAGDVIHGRLAFDPVPGVSDGPFTKHDLEGGLLELELEGYSLRHTVWQYTTGLGLFLLRTTDRPELITDGRLVRTTTLAQVGSNGDGAIWIEEGPTIFFRLHEPLVIPEPAAAVLFLLGILFLSFWRFDR